ncbi:MAG TPA: metabolite traffic protein EboE, partial [Verrucomicrobiae bacterium]|nr:metabolite traffic protein EboE [Verrucomicrobiae bacterium]
MKLKAGLHLAYCTNVHRGHSWAETFESLKNYTLRVRDRVSPNQPYAIGLRLSNRAAHELNEPAAILDFHRWLGKSRCYVFTINGFSFGQFHGGSVKEDVYKPDWNSPERLAYTNVLFDILAQLLPQGVEGSVSTLPCSFKGFHPSLDALKAMRRNIWRCVEHIARLSEQTGRKMHLGLEPEPLCILESSGETVQFFDRMRSEFPHDPRLGEHLGVNYDTCHFAVEFEKAQNALPCLLQHGIKISKIHLSSALKLRPTIQARKALAGFAEDVYLHQVVVRHGDGSRLIYADLPAALAGEPQELLEAPAGEPVETSSEWRIHFHIPLHHPPTELFSNT